MTKQSAAVLLVLLATPARAAGPLYVNGAGTPLVWTASPVPFNPDQGTLGTLDNAQAVQQVADDFGVWSAVPTASVAVANAGALPVDVTAANVTDYLQVCGDGLSPIIFDTDGSITDDVFGTGASNNILGFAGPQCVSMSTATISEGLAVLNGKWIDGIDTPSNPEISLAEFDTVFTHEFGHYLNLDHSQINLIEGLDADSSNDAAVATMFPIFVNGTQQASLHLDDKVSISMLYPASGFTTGYGTITGDIFRPDGTTPFQGAYVIARRVTDPRNTAVGVASGARYFPGTPGGPPAPGLQGLYEIPGLPPGSYTVEVEAIYSGFFGVASVGPLDPPVPLPGVPEFWNGANEAGTDPPDDPSASVAVSVAAGGTQSAIDIIVNQPTPATNDDCLAPTVIATTPFDDMLEVSGATGSPDDPIQSCSGSGPSRNWNSVWYAFTPPEDGAVTAETVGSSYDTVLTAYTGDCQRPREVACSDDAIGLASEVSFVVPRDTPILFEVTRFAAPDGGILHFHLSYTPFPNPVCTGGVAIVRPKLALKKLGPPAGDEWLAVGGSLLFPLGVPAVFNPSAKGAQLRIDDLGSGAAAIFDLSHLTTPIPAGYPGSGCDTLRDGWKGNSAGTTQAYRNSSNALPAACTPGSANGLTTVQLRDKRATKGVIDFKAKTRNSTIATPVGPLRATIVLGATATESDAGECGAQAFFPVQCRLAGTSMKCR